MSHYKVVLEFDVHPGRQVVRAPSNTRFVGLRWGLFGGVGYTAIAVAPATTDESLMRNYALALVPPGYGVHEHAEYVDSQGGIHLLHLFVTPILPDEITFEHARRHKNHPQKKPQGPQTPEQPV